LVAGNSLVFPVPLSKKAEQLIAELKKFLPELDIPISYARKWCEAGKILLALKREVGHGNYGPARAAAGYSKRKAELCIQIYRSNPDTDQLKMPIEKLLTHIRKGKSESFKAALAEHAELHRDSRTDSQIIHGDSLNWLKAQPDESVSYFVSDPPYGIGMIYEGWTEPNTPQEHYQWFRNYWNEMVRCLAPGGVVVIWQDYRYLEHFKSWFPSSLIDCIPLVLRGHRAWQPLIRFFKKGEFKGDSLFGLPVWLDPVHGGRTPEFKEAHVCPKNPVEAEAVVKFYTTPGSLVVDPFCGSGTIPAACKKLGRKYIGIERNPKYVKLARSRLG
jgi:SAM-dependent methyltransferase